MGQTSKIEGNVLWDALITHQGEQFTTSGRGNAPGKQFTYTIEGGQMFISTKEKSITKATAMVAYSRAIQLQEKEGYVSGPKKIGTFGASYLYPIFLRLGVIARPPAV